MAGLLAGMRVVEGSAFVAAPSGGMTLAQLGADVIRFDQIGGGIDYGRWPVTADGTSLYWTGLNKGKRSIALDLRNKEAQELLTALVTAGPEQPSGRTGAGPDGGILLTNFPPRGWMDYEKLRARRADVIQCVITGNHDGSTAVDYTVNPAVGYPSVTGPLDRDEPVNHVLPAWDHICGQSAAIGILAADRHRARTGEGQQLTVALSDIALAVVSAMGHVAEAQVNGEERPRLGNDLYGAFGRDFDTADGRRVMPVAISDRQWVSLPQPRDDLMRRRMDSERARDVVGGALRQDDDRYAAARHLAEHGGHGAVAAYRDDDIRCFPKSIGKAVFRDQTAGRIDAFPAENRQQFILRWSIVAGGGAADQKCAHAYDTFGTVGLAVSSAAWTGRAALLQWLRQVFLRYLPPQRSITTVGHQLKNGSVRSRTKMRQNHNT